MRIDQDTIISYTKGIPNENTRKNYHSLLNRFIKFLEENQIEDVTQQNINKIVHDYKAYLTKQEYKNITINHHLIALKTFINDYTTIDYHRKLKLLKTKQREPKYLTKKQIQTALKYTDNKTDELIIRLLSNTGLRIHEALQITKKELQNTDQEGNVTLTVYGKNTKRRRVIINHKLAYQLQKYSKHNQKYVFESQRKKGQQMSKRGIQHRFKKLATKIDQEENTKIYTENLKPHNLRHSFAIHALKNNEINYVKEFLGHESIVTTQIYTKLKEKDILDKFKKIDEI